MTHTKAAVAKARSSSSRKKQDDGRKRGDGRKTPANRFNDLPVHERRCTWNQPVTASQNKDGFVTFTCPCGHKTQMRLNGIIGIPDGFAAHRDTHPVRETK